MICLGVIVVLNMRISVMSMIIEVRLSRIDMSVASDILRAV